MHFFTADEHYGHSNIIKYCNRPYADVEEMNEDIIEKHNAVVKAGDFVIHAGDFTFRSQPKYAERLNGSNIFIKGNHDNWLKKTNAPHIWSRKLYGVHIVVCHYALRSWDRSHFNSWNLHGHTHGRLDSIGKQLDVGVDTNEYRPYSFDEVYAIMETKEDNIGLIEDKYKRVNHGK